MKNSEIYNYMLSVLDKAENGPVLDENDWDFNYINRTIKDLIEKYDIHWDWLTACMKLGWSWHAKLASTAWIRNAR